MSCAQRSRASFAQLLPMEGQPPAAGRLTMVQVSEVEDEVARLRDLDLIGLRARWRLVVGRAAPKHLPQHLLVRILAYRIQADAFGDLSRDSVRLLDRIAAGQGGVPAPVRTPRPGTVLVREGAPSRHGRP